MSNPTQQQYDDCAYVLQHMAKSTQQHEPYAVNTIANIEAVIAENSFMQADYPETT